MARKPGCIRDLLIVVILKLWVRTPTPRVSGLGQNEDGETAVKTYEEQSSRLS